MSMQMIGKHDPKTKRLIQPTYTDGRTKQSFKDETDINKILERAQSTGTISHLNRHEGRYGDFADFDFQQAQFMLAQGREVFDDLPSEIRNEFNQSPAQFFDYVNDPANKDDLIKKLPGLAAPGRQNIQPNQNLTADQQKAADKAAAKGSTEETAKPKPTEEVATSTKGPETTSPEPSSPAAEPPSA